MENVIDAGLALPSDGVIDFFHPKGVWKVEHLDKDGNVKGVYEFPNGITNQGKNTILDTYFNALTQIAASSWFIGLIDNAGTPTLAAGDTMASHAWTEWQSYDETTRRTWGQGSASAQSVTNAVAATFTINAAGTLFGIFIVSVNTKGGTTGTLWSTAGFPATVPVAIADQMKVTYTIAC